MRLNWDECSVIAPAFITLLLEVLSRTCEHMIVDLGAIFSKHSLETAFVVSIVPTACPWIVGHQTGLRLFRHAAFVAWKSSDISAFNWVQRKARDIKKQRNRNDNYQPETAICKTSCSWTRAVSNETAVVRLIAKSCFVHSDDFSLQRSLKFTSTWQKSR